MVNFRAFLIESSESDYADLLNDAMSLIDAAVGQNQVWVNDAGKKVIITLSAENYIQMDTNGKIIKTQKLYKDGEITNYDLACTRLKNFISAIKAEQFVSAHEE